MWKRIAALLAAMLLMVTVAQAEEMFAVVYQAREMLEAMDITVTDEAFESYKEIFANYQKVLAEHGISMETTRESAALELLATVGMGEYDYETDTWTPTSDQVYAFDAEVYNIEKMYTLFLQGVESIVPDVAFTDIQEDLSNVRWDVEGFGFDQGTRDVSFLCNGKPYRFTLDDHGDWFNAEMIERINGVLKEAGCTGQLHLVSSGFAQTVTLYYGETWVAATLYALSEATYGDMSLGWW